MTITGTAQSPTWARAATQAHALRSAAEVVIFQTDGERIKDSSLTQTAAARFLGVDEAAVRMLLASGVVATLDTPEGPAIAYHDAAALGLHCRLGSSMPELGLSMMMRFARQTRDALLAPLRWSFSVRCPASPTAGAELRVPGVGATVFPDAPGDRGPNGGWPLRPGEGTAEGRASLDGLIETYGVGHRILDRGANALYDQTLADIADHRVRFQWVSVHGRRDPLARWREGRVDCVCLAAVLAAELDRLGLETRIESGRILGVLDAQHTWVSVRDDDGAWKRFDPLLQAHCWRLWGRAEPYGELFRGAVTNALIGWPGQESAVVTGHDGGKLDVEHQFLAWRLKK
jgi:Transglutaminase-like superfamily